jgi:hypothetical protein
LPVIDPELPISSSTSRLGGCAWTVLRAHAGPETGPGAGGDGAGVEAASGTAKGGVIGVGAVGSTPGAGTGGDFTATSAWQPIASSAVNRRQERSMTIGGLR